MKVKIWSFILVLVIFLNGCVPIVVNAQKSPGFSKQISSVVIWHETETPVKILGIQRKMRIISEMIASELKSKGVNNVLIATKEETLNQAVLIKNSLQQLETNYYLRINVPSGSYSRSRSQFNIHVTLIDSKAAKERWKSSTSFVFENQSNADAAKSIVDKMVQDGIIANH